MPKMTDQERLARWLYEKAGALDIPWEELSEWHHRELLAIAKLVLEGKHPHPKRKAKL